MMRSLVVFVAACGAAAGPGVRAAKAPLVLTDKAALTVPVEIDGHRFTFQLDTGASETAITQATWKTLGLPHGEAAESHGAGGAIAGTEVVPLRELRVGGEAVRDLRVSVMALDEVGAEEKLDGILGQDVLGRFVTEVDIPGRTLVLHPAGSTAWRTPELIGVDYTEAMGLIRLGGALDGRPIAAILDLGAGATIANRRAAPEAVAVEGAAALGADGAALQMASAKTTKLAIGEVAFGVPQVFVSDLPVFGVLGLADEPAIILGMDLLASRRVVIDRQAKRVYISRG
jgi:aspartyl protease